ARSAACPRSRCRRTPSRRSSTKSLDPHVQVVVVVDQRYDDVLGTLEVQVRADEDLDRAGGDEAVDEVLGELAVDVLGLHGARLRPVLARIEDVGVEPVLMAGVAEPAE